MSGSLQKKVRWRDALVAKVMAERTTHIVSNYWLATQLFELVQQRAYEGRELQLPKRPIDGRMLAEARDALINRRVLTQDRSLPNTLFRAPTSKDADPSELMCSIDPFGCIAYLSAMAYYGLTNRLPKVLYFWSPEPRIWSSMADERMKKDLRDNFYEYVRVGLPQLRHSRVEKLDGIIIEQVRTNDFGGWRNARDGALRVTGIGRTFLHMLQRPDLCGGIRHVIGVFEQFATPHLPAIVTELNAHGGKVDKVRAGYILEEFCHIADPRVDAWKEYASRGGSRKLDAQAEYSSNFSEKWALSINV
ncbi:hypothetical protein [Lysobacter capsici]|uniref:hypothetical protein n=1 Tax=Lysobacter capsici TaxID=435897 RepID=UPI00287BA336|nr:hypothetical protein [Lysobacter capsici]WND81124.1 hypothetical protein RJ610_01730 [Lysobacter capsici]WND86320.1 hypothetical protein RJ609_01730 [Lysobacter capsici]